MTIMRKWLSGVVVLAAACVVGCGAIPGILFPEVTTVRLINNANFPVEFELFYGDDENTLEVFLVEFGERVPGTLQPGDSTSISDDCDNLRAVIINDADLRVIGGIGPEADTDVLREGEDFDCRDTITFTFTSDVVGLQLGILTDVSAVTP
jgi:hypothetical protein